MVPIFVDVPAVPVHTVVWWFVLDAVTKMSLSVVEVILNLAGLAAFLYYSLRPSFSCGRNEQEQSASSQSHTPSCETTSVKSLIRRPGTDASGKDANAGVVGATRYLAAGQPLLYNNMDGQVRLYEYMFMSALGRCLTWFAELIPIIGRVALHYEGGILAARTVVMDKLMSRFLLRPFPCQRPCSSSLSTASMGSSSPDSPLTSATRTEEMPRKQVLILGAGFDSRAYRLPEIVDAAKANVSWIEVDQAAVQRVKLERLRAGLGEARFRQVTSNVEYVSVNFAHEGALEAALENSRSFDASLPTFVLWEGVTYYLPLIAIHATLATLTKLRLSVSEPAEWKLVFDFTDDVAFSTRERVSQRLNWAFLGILNHPCQSCLPFSQEKMQGELGRHKLEVNNIWSGAELIGQNFPSHSMARNFLGIHMAECRWLNGV